MDVKGFEFDVLHEGVQLPEETLCFHCVVWCGVGGW